MRRFAMVKITIHFRDAFGGFHCEISIVGSPHCTRRVGAEACELQSWHTNPALGIVGTSYTDESQGRCLVV